MSWLLVFSDRVLRFLEACRELSCMSFLVVLRMRSIGSVVGYSVAVLLLPGYGVACVLEDPSCGTQPISAREQPQFR